MVKRGDSKYLLTPPYLARECVLYGLAAMISLTCTLLYQVPDSDHTALFVVVVVCLHWRLTGQQMPR